MLQPQADGAPVDHQVEALVQRLAEMERMAELCGHKMSVHLRKSSSYSETIIIIV